MLKKRNIIVLLCDLGILLCAFLCSVLFFYYRDFSAVDWGAYAISFAVMAVFNTLFRYVLRTYRCIWRFAGAWEFLRVVVADFAGGTVLFLANLILRLIDQRLQLLGLREILLITCLVSFATLGSRLVYQLLLRFGFAFFSSKKRNGKHVAEHHRINVAIVGAGQIGAHLAYEMRVSRMSHYRPYCFVETNTEKIGQFVEGVRVYSEEDFINNQIHDFPIQEIVIAIPGLHEKERQRMFDLYHKTGCKVKVYDYPVTIGEKNTRMKMREFQIEDLLFREPLSVNGMETLQYYRNKTVLVTGGGGSIGSEICRQLAKLQPRRLIIVDIYENNAYDIQQELIRNYGDSLDLCVEIASVRDRVRLECVFATYRPDVVFHAAAHKHVPLMEHSRSEAIKNNVFGTYNAADFAEKYGAKKFILVSTDKAVNPTNIMGASKRMCEMVVQCRTDSATEFAAVRFGNVLGSNGSVIPLFARQIAKGGPVTLTDKRIVRYFMTIPEASQLVMQAGAIAKRGELFVLDMGKPIRILDLAENMIRLSGYTPYEDIDIVEIGLRPGEKLYEELLMKNENLDKTENSMIFIEKDTPLSRAEVEEKLSILRNALEEGKTENEANCIKTAMMRVVPTYHTPEEVNKTAAESEEIKAANHAE